MEPEGKDIADLRLLAAKLANAGPDLQDAVQEIKPIVTKIVAVIDSIDQRLSALEKSH